MFESLFQAVRVLLVCHIAGNQSASALERFKVLARHNTEAVRLVFNAVGLSPCLDTGHEGSVVVTWHGGEKVVLKLVLHTTKEVLSHRVRADNVARAPELRLRGSKEKGRWMRNGQ